MATIGKIPVRHSRKNPPVQKGTYPNDLQAINIDGPSVPGQPHLDLPNIQRIVTENVIPNASERKISRREKKEQLKIFREEDQKLPEFEIISSSLSFLSSEEMKNLSVVEVNNDAEEGINSINDPKLGTIDTEQICGSCFKSSQDCPGHYGLIKLNKKIYNPINIVFVVLVLQSVCNDCGDLLISPEEFENYESLIGKDRLKEIVELSKKKTCSRLPIQGTKLCRKNPVFSGVNKKNSSKISAKIDKKKIEIAIEDIYDILDNISEETAKFLGFTAPSHPRNFILDYILVIPPCARPFSVRDGVRYPNPLNKLYRDIIKANREYLLSDNKKDKDKALTNIIRHYNQIIGGPETADLIGEYPGITNLIKGKTGLIRMSIMGSRANYTARTVIGPDPHLKFGQVGIPKEFASVLTRPEVVTSSNIDYLQNLVDNKKASSVTFEDGTQIVDDKPITIQLGNIVHRHLQDGDYNIFNRQPTLHKQGMMSGEVVLHSDRNIKIHLSNTSGYNADFDGDEMNLHMVQTEEAYLEVRHLLNTINCILNPQSNMPTAGAVFDALTGSYLMTSDRTIVSESVFQRVLFALTERSQLESLNQRFKKYKMNPLSGKALFSSILPEDFFYFEGSVVIKEGILIAGNISKKHIGISPISMIIDLHKIYGKNRAASFISDISFTANIFLSQEGFSVGLADCYSDNPELREIIREEVGISKYFAMSFKQDVRNSLESKRQEEQVVGKLRSTIGRIAGKIKEKGIKFVEPSMAIMAASGAKGSAYNVSQMSMMLGQQFLWGERMKMAMTDQSRCSPYFKEGEVDPEARGFCVSSFSEGLTPAELWYHVSGSREGLIDTAIKTAETGYSHRKINKLLEDLMIDKHGMVLNGGTDIIQFIYGDDGLRPDRLQRRPFGEKVEVATFINLDIIVAQINSKFGFV